MTQKPNLWIAAILGLILPPTGMLYVGQWLWALAYFIASLGLALWLFLSPGENLLAVSGAFAAYPVISAVHGYWLARRFPEGAHRPRYSRWYGLLGIWFGFFIFIFSFRAFFFEPFRVPSSSMEPAISPGAFVVVQKWGYGHYDAYGVQVAQRPLSSPLERGDIVVFNDPEVRSLTYVKRLLGLPGDRLDQLDLPCVPGPQGPVCEIPQGHYYVVGDNRDNSMDSRMFGFVPADHIVGKVVFVTHRGG